MNRDSTQIEGTVLTIPELTPDTEYRYRLSAYCPDYGWTDYGPWRTFRTDECRAPAYTIEEPVDRSTFRLSWPPSAGENQYAVDYRLAEPGAAWVTLTTTLPGIELAGLRSNAVYEYRISEVCAGGGLRTTPVDSFRLRRPTLAKGIYQCGLPPEDVDLSNLRPLPHLAAGDTIRAFDFDVVVTAAYGSGGTFGGTGEIRIPYFNAAKFSFTFDRLVINDEYRVVGGYLQATGFGVEILGETADILLADALDLLGDLDAMLANGQAEELLALLDCCADQLDPTLAAQLQAAADCLAAATTPEQQAACQPLLAAAQALAQASQDSLLAGDFQVKFVASPSPAFGFDGSGDPQPTAWYETRTIAGAPYAVAYQSVRPGASETVVAVLPPGVSADSVRFTQPGGLPVTTTVRGDSVLLEFTGQPGAPYYLAAEQVGSDSGTAHIAGLLRIVPYPPLPLDVVLVPLNGAPLPTPVASLTDQLKSIFGQAVVEPRLTVAAPFYPADYDGTLDAVPSGLLANYAPEMRDLIRAYENEVGVDPDTYYLFLVDDFDPTDRAGFMPRGRPYGFLYLGPGHAGTGPAFARTLAHELAHGAYVLEHTFEAYPAELPRGSTANLLDYAGGTELYKWQWDLVHDPVSRPWLVGDEASTVVGSLLLLDALAIAGHEGVETLSGTAAETYVTPAGEQFTLPPGAIAYVITCEYPPYNLPIGSLLGYSHQGKYYSSLFIQTTQRFTGYAEIYPAGSAQPFSDQYQESLEPALDADGLVTLFSYRLLEPDSTTAATTIAKFTTQTDPLPPHDGSSNRDNGGVPIADTLDLPGLTLVPGSRMTYDGRCGYPDLSTPQPVVNICNELAAETSYAPAEVQELADTYAAGVRTRHTYPYGTRGQGDRFHLLATPGSEILLTAAEREVWEDQLFLLREKTGIDFFVIFHRRAEPLSKTAAEALLGAALDRADAADALAVLVPYTSNPYAGTCGRPVYQLSGQVEVGAVDLELPGGLATAADYIRHVFAQVRKPLYLANVLLLADGSIFNYEITRDGVIGFPYLNQLTFYASSEIAYRQTLPDCGSYLPLTEADYSPAEITAYFDCTAGNQTLREVSDQREQQALDRLFAAPTLGEKLALLDGPDWQRWTHRIDLRPAYIEDPAVVLSYANYHQFSQQAAWLANLDYLFSQHFSAGSAYDSELHSYTAIDWFTVVDPLVYGASDLLGVLPVVGDFADGIAFLYASVVRHDPYNTVAYGASFAALGGLANVLTATAKRYVVVAEFAEDGVAYSVKRFDEVADVTDIRYSTLARSQAEAEQILRLNTDDGLDPAWPIDAIYASPTLGLPKSTAAERATAKLIAQDIFRRAPQLAADIPGKLTPEVGAVLVGVSNRSDRIQLLDRLAELEEAGGYADWVADLGVGGDELVAFFQEALGDGVRAWDIIKDLSENIRFAVDNLNRLSIYVRTENADVVKLKNSLANTRNEQKWIDLKITQAELADIYDGIKNDPPFDLTPWTSEHKAQRWSNYQEGCANGQNACLDFESWSNGYDGKIDLVTSTSSAVDDYFASLGWNCPSSMCREQTINVMVNGQSRNRRLDILDRQNGVAKEFKEYSSGKVYRSADIRLEVESDKALLASGFLIEVEWVFKGCTPSGPLRTLLESSPTPISITILP
jgi:hypothetical protein